MTCTLRPPRVELIAVDFVKVADAVAVGVGRFGLVQLRSSEGVVQAVAIGIGLGLVIQPCVQFDAVGHAVAVGVPFGLVGIEGDGQAVTVEVDLRA